MQELPASVTFLKQSQAPVAGWKFLKNSFAKTFVIMFSATVDLKARAFYVHYTHSFWCQYDY